MSKARKFSPRVFALIGCAGAAICAGTANAEVIRLESGNAFADLDTDFSFMLHSWEVDGVNHLTQQSVWMRYGTQTDQTFVGSLLQQTGVSNSAASATLNYSTFAGAEVPFNLGFTFSLTGGSTGSGYSTLLQSTTLQHAGASGSGPVTISLFKMVDLDVDGDFENDLAIQGATSAQTGLLGSVVNSSATLAPSRWEYGFYPDYPDLFDLVPSLQLLYGPADPALQDSGDLQFALQWDITLQEGQTISFDYVHAVPEPGTLLLAASAIPLLWRRRREQR